MLFIVINAAAHARAERRHEMKAGDVSTKGNQGTAEASGVNPLRIMNV